MAFIRFVRPNVVPGTDFREGFLQAAYELRDAATTDADTLARLEELLAWFRANLIVPPRFGRSRSKGHDRRATKGLSWFRDDATAVVGKAFELMALLREAGYPVEIIRTDRVGYVVYEDAQQVIAEPFSDTPV